ncbi:hypothetical protein FIU94_12085 [Sulfitobacter sp. THAF37]|uniref:DUF1801 domain-containing protein n=1 Tax=Sulfitobacter sp. THAF37 TaxID=2587855 RepID=UPI001268535F|nr:DUF1801 domain-containing protein [Sulfitobacter sp. THAF37]QFT59564.1 hypothetical protein FIU94_12085 [Sulfitobacter sp. THAF37]
MQQTPAPFLSAVQSWPLPARDALWACRAVFHATAEQTGIGPLEESLKWGQPAWRPRAPRTGSTLRMGWTPDDPDRISLFVDCKTDLAARMAEIYPDIGANDNRRQIRLDLTRPLPDQAIAHLSQMTFCYHLSQRGLRPVS